MLGETQEETTEGKEKFILALGFRNKGLWNWTCHIRRRREERKDQWERKKIRERGREGRGRRQRHRDRQTGPVTYFLQLCLMAYSFPHSKIGIMFMILQGINLLTKLTPCVTNCLSTLLLEPTPGLLTETYLNYITVFTKI